ncbi:hypothetical protein METH_16880 [Leisingera methylohalidivorans DSM 14336]|uniref:FAD dependent oxidoreductase domain-containing protein n=1 Tax=Leisingera methylohalidivorans DSM 14336 TaxID=999552 RepID=V9VZJ3_9RHOB|nr:hypothetical protein METH_16880 [Leisingera methylohalidivorans DSM 14336]
MPDCHPHILVAGAGINGLMAAYYLIRAGARVTVCEAGPVPNPASASYGAHRLIHPWPPAGRPQEAAAAQRALPLWRALLQDIGCSGFVQTGVLVASPEACDAAAGEHTLRLLPARADALLAGAAEMPGAVLFPEFGVLLAEKILSALCNGLAKRGVEFLPRAPLRGLDTATGAADIAGGAPQRFDGIVCALGWKSRDLEHIAGAGEFLAQFSPRRSYVVYLPEAELPEARRPRTAWTGFLGQDLWGMPALGRNDAKFGCGLLTHSADEPVLPDNEVRAKMAAAYSGADPAYRALLNGRVASNIWAMCPFPGMVQQAGLCTVITSDTGGGFKTAPLAGLAACEAVLAAVPGWQDLKTQKEQLT